MLRDSYLSWVAFPIDCVLGALVVTDSPVEVELLESVFAWDRAFRQS